MLSPLYIAEIAPAKIRGKLVSMNQFAIIFGMLVVYFVNYFIAKQGDDSWLNEFGWRYMFASELIPVTIFLILLYTVPDTPRSLVYHDNEEKALEVLKKVNDAVSGGKFVAIKTWSRKSTILPNFVGFCWIFFLLISMIFFHFF